MCIFYQAFEVHRVSAHYCVQDLLVFHCTWCTGLFVHWYTVHGALFSPHITDWEHSTTPFIHVGPSRIQSA